jgi:uncharacterized membrane protein
MMTEPKEGLSHSATVWWALVCGLIALTTVTTVAIRIPVPATTGYFNLGDVFVILSGLLLGPRAGLVVGAVGSGLADAIGYPQFILATAVTKGLEGAVVGLISSSSQDISLRRATLAAGIGSALMVIGYFTFEALIYPMLGEFMPLFQITNLGDAIVEVVPNTLQAILGTIGGVALWNMTKGLTAIRHLVVERSAKPRD